MVPYVGGLINNLLLFDESIDQLLHDEFEQCITLLGSTMKVPDDDKFIKLVKRLYERGSRYIPALKTNYQSQKRLW